LSRRRHGSFLRRRGIPDGGEVEDAMKEEMSIVSAGLTSEAQLSLSRTRSSPSQPSTPSHHPQRHCNLSSAPSSRFPTKHMCVSGCVSRWRFPCAACLTWILSLACLDHSHSLCPGKKDKLRKSVVHSHVKAKAQICNAGKIRPSHTEGAPQTEQSKHSTTSTPQGERRTSDTSISPRDPNL
jgi:hypothetical protein